MATLTTSDNKRLDVITGRGTTMEFGVRFDLMPFDRPAWKTELTLGFKMSDTVARDRHISLSRVLFSISQFYRFRSGIRIGLGGGVHAGNRLDSEFSAYEDVSVAIDPAIAYSTMIEWTSMRWFAFGVRHTSVNYDIGNSNLSGNSIAGYFTFQMR